MLTNLMLGHVTAAPVGGRATDDPIGEASPGGLMRVWSVGQGMGSVPLGSLRLGDGAVSLEPLTCALEGGMVLFKRAGGSTFLSPCTSSGRNDGRAR